MLGQLNAERPFTDDGWFRTGVIQGLLNVADLAVSGKPHLLLGQIMRAHPAPGRRGTVALAQRIQRACGERVERYKVPVKATARRASLTLEHFKTARRRGEA